jgi:excisionase family DNA binding protein
MEPLALSPRDACAFLGVSKRTLTRLIAGKKVEARKDGSRTLVDVASLKAHYASLPKVERPAPLYCSIMKPKARSKAKPKTQH